MKVSKWNCQKKGDDFTGFKDFLFELSSKNKKRSFQKWKYPKNKDNSRTLWEDKEISSFFCKFLHPKGKRIFDFGHF